MRVPDQVDIQRRHHQLLRVVACQRQEFAVAVDGTVDEVVVDDGGAEREDALVELALRACRTAAAAVRASIAAAIKAQDDKQRQT